MGETNSQTCQNHPFLFKGQNTDLVFNFSSVWDPQMEN